MRNTHVFTSSMNVRRAVSPCASKFGGSSLAMNQRCRISCVEIIMLQRTMLIDGNPEKNTAATIVMIWRRSSSGSHFSDFTMRKTYVFPRNINKTRAREARQAFPLVHHTLAWRGLHTITTLSNDTNTTSQLLTNGTLSVNHR